MTENNGVSNGYEREPLENQSSGGWKEVLQATPKPADNASSEDRYNAGKQFIRDNMRKMSPALRELVCKKEVLEHFRLTPKTITEILASLYPKGQSDTEDLECSLLVYPSEIIDKAIDILEKGDPWKFIQETWQKYHIGDEIVGELCACSFASTHLTNSQGVQLKPSGASGKGKSDALDDFAELIPAHRVFRGSMSGMAAYYKNELRPGTVFLLDDTDLNRTEGLKNTIKRATTNFQQKTKHSTVVKGKGIELEIPERCVWWISSVSGVDDDQIGNRFIPVDVDTSSNQDSKVHEWQTENHLFGTLPDSDDDVQVCRAMYHLLGRELYKITIPFIKCIKWTNKENRRNWLMFIDIVMGITFHYIKQREKVGDSHWATVEDCEKAISIYKVIAERNATKLTAQELKVMRWWSMSAERNRPIERKDITDLLNVSARAAINILEGRNGKGGLLAKVPGIRQELTAIRSETNSSGKSTTTHKLLYYYDGSFGIGSYSDVVSLDYGRIEKETEAFRARLLTDTPLTPLTQHSHTQCVSDKSVSLDNIDTINSTLTHKKGDIKNKNNQGDLVISPVKTNNNTSKSGQKVCKSSPDDENGCVSGVQVCDSGSADAEHLDIKKIFPACKAWEQWENSSINSTNCRDVAMEYVKDNNLPPEMVDDITKIVKKYAKIPDPVASFDDW